MSTPRDRAEQNLAIRARKAAAEQRRRRADERFRESVEGPERAQRAKREQQLAWMRDVDPAAADAAKELDTWKALVRRVEDSGDADELKRARRALDDRERRWTVLAATHPRLRHLVSEGLLKAFADDLQTPVARALADLNEAREQVAALQRSGAPAGEVDAAEATYEVARARWHLEMDNSSWEEQRRQKLERAGIQRPPTKAEQTRRRRMAALQRFITEKTPGSHPHRVEGRASTGGTTVQPSDRPADTPAQRVGDHRPIEAKWIHTDDESRRELAWSWEVMQATTNPTILGGLHPAAAKKLRESARKPRGAS